MKPYSAFSLLGLLLLLALGSPARTWATTDLDRDGKGDLVWRHIGTGDVGVWLMDGLGTRQGAVVATVADLGWQIVGIGDVDGDGKGDLVWHHAPTGQVQVWLMDGLGTPQGAVVATLADLGWRIVAVGDVDGDGKADVVRHHTSTGEVAVWFMNGVTIRQDAVVGMLPDLGWRIVGVADADGDGKADVVRHHALTGEVGLWLMNGAGIRQDAVVATIDDLGWQIVDVGDVDGDRKADLVWRHARTGEVGVWLMDGMVARQGAVVATIDDLDWEIAGVADVDGDSKADLTWHHARNGQVGVWLMNGVSVRQGAVAATVSDRGWQLQPERSVGGRPLIPGAPRTGVISGAGQVDLYEFWVNAPTRVVVQATRVSGGVNPCVAVSTGNPSQPVAGGASCAVDDKSGKFARVDLTLAAGIYTVAVHDAGDNDQDSTYHMLMVPVTEALSAPLAAGEPQLDAIDRVGNINLYQFALDVPTRVVLEATRKGGVNGVSPCLEVYTGSPAQLVSGGAACAGNTPEGRVSHLDLELAAGTYFVAVHDAGEDDKAKYHLLLLPLTPATSTALSPGVPQTGSISVVGDVNVHQFTLGAPARVVVQVLRSSGGVSGINPCLEVYSGEPAQPVAGSAVCAANTATPTSAIARLELTLPAGTHFVTVRDAGGDGDGDYSVLMLPLVAEASTSLAVGVPQTGTISPVGELDLYQFSLGAPAQVHVQVTRTGKGSRVTPCLEVYAGAPAQLVSGGAVCASTKVSIGKVAQVDLSLAAGTYFVVVRDAAEDDVGDYTVAVSTSSP